MTLTKMGIIRVVVADESSAMLDRISALLKNSENIHVIGSALTGEEAIRQVKRNKPDVLLLSEKIRGGGFDVTRQLMREAPLPVILTAVDARAQDSEFSGQALKAGAVAVARKPEDANPQASANLVQLIRTMAGLKVVHHWGREKNVPRAKPTAPLSVSSNEIPALAASVQIIGMAASTGGPTTVASILSALPGDFPLPILLVQHVKPGFGPSMVSWLATQTELKVRPASAGEIPQPGTVLFAPDDFHLMVNTRGQVELSKAPHYKTLRPSANFLFQSLGTVFGARAMGIVLTGMGDDGVDGLEALYQAGGYVVGQDEDSCVVYGMPRAAYEHGVVTRVLSPGAIVHLLVGMALEKKNAPSRT